MGHLTNANSFRLGWYVKWKDMFYSAYNYSEYMYACLRQRGILRMFFYAKIMDKTPYIFSHFEILKFFRNFDINIFFYYIPYLNIMHNLGKRLWWSIKRSKKRYYSSEWFYNNRVPERKTYLKPLDALLQGQILHETNSLTNKLIHRTYVNCLRYFLLKPRIKKINFFNEKNLLWRVMSPVFFFSA